MTGAPSGAPLLLPVGMRATRVGRRIPAMDDLGLGPRFWFRTAGLVVGVGILLLLGFLIFSGIYARLGVVGAFVVVFIVGVAFAYRADKKKQRQYDAS